MDWYYINGNMQAGPVTNGGIARLITSGAVRSSTPVWHEGMADWLPAERTELASKFTAQSEPLPPPYRKQLTETEQQEPPAVQKRAPKANDTFRIIGGAVCFIVGLVGFFAGFVPSLVGAGFGFMLMVGWIGGRK
jgi:hypothetical protein